MKEKIINLTQERTDTFKQMFEIFNNTSSWKWKTKRWNLIGMLGKINDGFNNNNEKDIEEEDKITTYRVWTLHHQVVYYVLDIYVVKHIYNK